MLQLLHHVSKEFVSLTLCQLPIQPVIHSSLAVEQKGKDVLSLKCPVVVIVEHNNNVMSSKGIMG